MGGRVTLTSDFLHPNCYNTMVIYCNVCLTGRVKICQIVLEISRQNGWTNGHLENTVPRRPVWPEAHK